MSDGEWFFILCIACVTAFIFGSMFGTYKEGEMYREELKNCQNEIRKEISSISAKYILDKQGNYHGYYEGVYRGLMCCLCWLERV